MHSRLNYFSLVSAPSVIHLGAVRAVDVRSIEVLGGERLPCSSGYEHLLEAQLLTPRAKLVEFALVHTLHLIQIKSMLRTQARVRKFVIVCTECVHRRASLVLILVAASTKKCQADSAFFTKT